jgi:hypothetical protein
MMDQTNVAALQEMRQEFEEATPAVDWPAAAVDPLMLLADVVHALGGDEDQAREVLGEPAYTYVRDLIGDGGTL